MMDGINVINLFCYLFNFFLGRKILYGSYKKYEDFFVNNFWFLKVVCIFGKDCEISGRNINIIVRFFY